MSTCAVASWLRASPGFLAIRELRAHGLFAKIPTEGTLEWLDPIAAEALASACFILDDLAPNLRGLAIGYGARNAGTDGETVAVRETFLRRATPPPLPTHWFIQCAGCDHRVLAVYLALGRHRFRCRHCYGQRHHTVQHHDARIDRSRRGDFPAEPNTLSRLSKSAALYLRALLPRPSPLERPLLRIRLLDGQERSD